MNARRKNEAMQEVARQQAMEDRSAAEVAGYIADMVLELRNMAKDKELEFLAYLLEMSFQEAFDLSQKRGEE